MADNFGGHDPILEKFATKPLGSHGAIPCEPGATCETMEPVPGYEVCDPKLICHDLDTTGKLRAMPVASSMISGRFGTPQSLKHALKHGF